MLEVEKGSLKTSRSYHFNMPASDNWKRVMIASQIRDYDRVFLLYDDWQPDLRFILVKIDYRYMTAFKEQALRT